MSNFRDGRRHQLSAGETENSTDRLCDLRLMPHSWIIFAAGPLDLGVDGDVSSSAKVGEMWGRTRKEDCLLRRWARSQQPRC
jgi:hypothetical protein